ncbi:MAG: VWA domain-containing protein [Promethearchaeota archaeon]
MFVEYFFYLKQRLPVSITEYMTLMEALNQGLIGNMVEFYYISRSILCKNEHHFDLYDIAFVNFFKDAGLKFPDEIKEELWKWLEKNVKILHLPFDLGQWSQYFNSEDLEKQFRKLLGEQDKEHNFGNKWIGTQGTSPFGHSGQNPMGIRVAGEYGMYTAIKIAQKRIFKDYRKDLTLDTRQIKVALKRLKKLDDIGKKDELDLDKTIDETCKNGGDIELILKKRRKNNVKIVLLMDVGGTMDPYIHMVNLLFSAAYSLSHWKDFKYFYFHNCIYDKLYFNARRNVDESMDFEEFLRKYDSSYRIIIIGDQTMHRSELKDPRGAIYDGASNKKPGIYYIKRLVRHYKKNVVWLNPEDFSFEWMTWTRLVISKVIPTFPLTIQGIEQAMDFLRNNGKNIFSSVDLLKGVKLAYY